MKGKQEVQGQGKKEELQSRSPSVWNLQPHVRLIHQKEHQRLYHRILVEEKKQGQGSSQGASTGGASSGSNSQISTPHGGSSSTQFKMVGHDPTTRLPEFRGEASEDPEKHLFICENIWEAKQITDENTKLTQLSITLRDHALDWYMSLYVSSPPGVTRTIADMKKLMIN
jgi:hypothetical protein